MSQQTSSELTGWLPWDVLTAKRRDLFPKPQSGRWALRNRATNGLDARNAVRVVNGRFWAHEERFVGWLFHEELELAGQDDAA